MKINTIVDQGQGLVNEDSLLLGENIFGVFDGATSLDKYVDAAGKTGGYLASNKASEIFAASQPGEELLALANRANDAIQKEMLRRNIDVSDKINVWSTSAAVIRLRPDKFEWIQIGDSMIMLIYGDGSYKLLVEDYDHDQPVMGLWQELARQGETNIREKMMGPILKMRRSMNINYGILNGEKEMNQFINCGEESLDKVAHILIFSDGLFIPRQDITVPDDFQNFVELFLSGSLDAVKEYVRELEREDPDCNIYPRYKQHDDISAIAISL